MDSFPMIDPIPLPAPIWLFKILHLSTLTLHFTMMQIFLGGLLLASLLNAFGKSNGARKGAGAALARRLPNILTFVINFGVPPLLFTQVLYGPFLYTSSELIGVYWFAVIFLLMGAYWLLYKFSDGAITQKTVWWMGTLAFLFALTISKIYSTNMTLMLRPEVWQGMYAASPEGALLPPHDPTLIPRWLFMVTGAFWVSGLWMVWIAGRKTTERALGSYLAGLGGRVAALAICVQAGLFYLLLKAQPDVVKNGILASPLLNGVATSWCVIAVAVLIFSSWISVKKTCSYRAGAIAALLAVSSLASWTILRDGIRDVTLLSKGFDVWQQPVATNWGVVAVFAATLILGLAALGWLLFVMRQAKPVIEGELS